MATTRIFVDAAAIARQQQSGIGHTLLSTLRALDKVLDHQPAVRVTLICPWRGWDVVNSYGFKNLRSRRLPFPGRVLNVLARQPIYLPIELLLGRGVYVFPNYRNWRVLGSKSITHLHDICFALYPDFVKPNNQRMLFKNVPKWIRRTNLIATVSESSKQEIVKYYNFSPRTL